MIINVKDVPELPQVPTKGTPKSAAYDVISVSEPEIVGEKEGEYWKRIDYIQYRTALYAAPQKDPYGKDYHVLVHPRSSVSKYNLLLANGIGLCDTDYRGEYLVRFKYVWQPEDLRIENAKFVGKVNEERIYKKGDRVCQLVVEPDVEAEWIRIQGDLDKTERTGGFGSTDTNTIPVGQSSTTIKISKDAGIKEKPVEHEKTYESKIDLIDQWKKAGGTQEHPSTNYEKLIKEREKQLGNPK